MIRDENDVLTEEELVVVRALLKNSEYACLYIWNEFPRGFRLLNHVWRDYFIKWPNRLTSCCHLSLHLLWQSRHSLNTDVPSSANLTCFSTGNILLLPHLKQVHNEFSMGSCDFSRCRIKNRVFKNWVHFFQIIDKQKVNLRDKRMVTPSNRYIYFSIVFFFLNTHCFFFC